ncbi:SDR family NAD(P)-dependent oxidoreductase [Paraburkholderia caballeronis]|uniref:SDR family NAD(P)-dependent oxidoreductase n=1 Tax=Paraburkholderia caballeronis TaxID=416943 RepID=UPI001064B065|nr:SDR family oxidoreductase [Paraburkholderia caballeronis]TDV15682.1 NAD(P)-dependent dehydrogenase (short-subunit alcohol dehydrogenase family) [Paraburkholderia caballeronis]TDV17937.1 NAD(P)-dependent dehydrogenase (short-subunit alcohol dehydrogenase family) [Paraburkholderia caballeronis]TDV26449.1 NAD(P)-dependent dehydrogenase (short-subunit alcohol dehydrogenase family) [Paraburkholderia caballeronis]
MQPLLQDKIVLITGGGRGLGHAIGTLFAAHGARGALADLPSCRREPLPESMIALDCDVTSEASVDACVGATLERFGRIDVVVANAGVVPGWRATEALDFDEWDRGMAVNVKGVAITIARTADALRATRGVVVAMGSINSFTAHPRQMLYTASKHAVLGIVKAAALDLGPDGVRVNALAPGPIATDALLERIERRAAAGGLAVDEAVQQLATGTALQRLATAAEVAQAALFLASDLASGITGTLVPIDAGLRPA